MSNWLKGKRQSSSSSSRGSNRRFGEGLLNIRFVVIHLGLIIDWFQQVSPIMSVVGTTVR